MEVRRISNQGPQTVVEFYRELFELWAQERDRKLPQCMLDLLRELTSDGPAPLVWGVTSHERLALHATDDWKAPTLVFIAPHSDGSWHIECSLPPELQPWPEAIVTGHTSELSEAVRRVHLGLKWAGLIAV